MPSELQADISTRFLGHPQPVARLACASRHLQATLSDPSGRLLVSCVSLVQLVASAETLRRVCFPAVVEVRVDLMAENGKMLRRDVEHLVARLGGCLAGSANLQVLAVRLASVDAAMERLRLGRAAWESLTRGLHALAARRQLRSLELSNVPIKLSQATQPILGASAEQAGGKDGDAAPESLTFLRALSALTSLEELVLTHNDIFGNTALELADALARMPNLRVVDLTRNRISGKAMKHIAAALSPRVKVLGGDSQGLCSGGLCAQ